MIWGETPPPIDERSLGIGAGWEPVYDDPDKGLVYRSDESRFQPFGLGDLPDAFDFAPYLIDGISSPQSTQVHLGEYKSGKTFVELDQNLHIAAGRQWQGRDVEQGAVAYCFGEGQAALARRLAAAVSHHGFARDLPFVGIPTVPKLYDDGDIGDFIDVLKRRQEALGQPFAKVSIDTVMRATAGQDLNAQADVSKMWDQAERIGRELGGCCVSLVHHPGKDTSRGALGSVVFNTNADTLIELTKGDDGPTLEVKLQKDGEAGAMFPLKLVKVEIGKDSRNGNPIHSLAVEGREGGAPAAKIEKLTDRMRVVLKALTGLCLDIGQPLPRGLDLPDRLRGVSVDAFVDRVREDRLIDGDPKHVKGKLDKTIDSLESRGLAARKQGWIWPIYREGKV